MIQHQRLRLSPKPQGFHLVTEEILAQLVLPKGEGLVLLLLQHTSAGLCLNENADPDVRHDLDLYIDRLAPEHLPGIRHTLEGPDDMPAHVKALLTGVQLWLPFGRGELLLGTWQGIYLCEYRRRGGSRGILATVLT